MAALRARIGDAEPALDIYRRALSKSTHAVSEYVKVYASLWIADLTRLRDLALTKRMPFVWLLDSAGARIQEAVDALSAGS